MISPDRNIQIMGIVNLTDDSYFAASRCLDGSPLTTAMQRISTLLDEGADIIDIGACSTRPGSVAVGEIEEWNRIEPLLRELCERESFPRISIDTYHASVIRNAYELIAFLRGHELARESLIVNDISAGEDDAEMLPLVGRLGLTYIAMHKRGNSLTMQDLCDYDDVASEVLDYFEAFAVKAASYGIKDWIIDPGFGFAKTIEQNYELLGALSAFSSCGLSDSPVEKRRVLVGVSRKSMIYKKFGITPEESLPATQVLHLKALQCGADILRVHDVAEAARTLALYRLLR